MWARRRDGPPRPTSARLRLAARFEERRLRALISCWVVAGADRRTIERVLARALDELFGKGRRLGGAS